MASLDTRQDGLYVNDRRVLRGWESFSGWYWFALEDAGKQDSVLPDGREVKDDQIYFGLVQGFEDEFGYWAMSELDSLVRAGKVWEIKRHDLPYAGRRGDE